MYTESKLLDYLNAWQSDGKHLDATAEDIKSWLMDADMYTAEDAAFFAGWTEKDFEAFAHAIREHHSYAD